MLFYPIQLHSCSEVNVTSMNGMFVGCSSLISLDLSGFDTSNITDMNGVAQI